MSEKIEELKKACFAVAKTALWETRPVDVDIIQEYADRLFKEAQNQYELIEGLGGSIEIVTRAVYYIEQAHTIPPIKDDINWFSNTLRTLLEVACPNAGLDGKAREFLKDMINGISGFIMD